MVADSAPRAWKSGLSVRRLEEGWLDRPIASVLAEAAAAAATSSNDETPSSPRRTPVIYFSGVSNEDIRGISRLVASELFAETGQRAAVAKAVPPAMGRSTRQIFDEVSGDHEEALLRAVVGN